MPQLRQLFSSSTSTTSTASAAATAMQHRPAAASTTIRHTGSAAAAPTTPVRRTRLNSKDGTPSTRRRINSRDYVSTTNTDSSFTSSMYSPVFSSNGANSNILVGWCLVYLTALGVMQLMAIALVGAVYSTTLTNALHTLLTILSLHWIKGQPFDDTGSYAGWTLWEQLLVAGEECTSSSSSSATSNATNTMSHNNRRTLQSWLLLVPTILTYAACVQCHYNAAACAVNIVSWVVALVAKLPAMKGVRIFGINRTVGIDDDKSTKDEDGTDHDDGHSDAAAMMFTADDK